MKALIIGGICLGITLFAIAGISEAGLKTEVPKQYGAEGIVVDIEDNTTVVFETMDGNVWAFEDESYNVGDEIVVLFDSHRTTTLKDDEIVLVFKRGE